MIFFDYSISEWGSGTTVDNSCEPRPCWVGVVPDPLNVRRGTGGLSPMCRQSVDNRPSVSTPGTGYKCLSTAWPNHRAPVSTREPVPVYFCATINSTHRRNRCSANPHKTTLMRDFKECTSPKSRTRFPTQGGQTVIKENAYEFRQGVETREDRSNRRRSVPEEAVSKNHSAEGGDGLHSTDSTKSHSLSES